MAPNEVGTKFPVLGHDDVMNALSAYDELKNTEIPDETWMMDNVPQILKLRGELVTDDGALSRGAELVAKMMSEFAVEGSEFQPSQDDDLVRFIAEVVQREVPDIEPDEVVTILESIDDFPPIDRTQHDILDDQFQVEELSQETPDSYRLAV